MTYMAQPGHYRRSGRSLKTNEKSVKNDLINRLAHKNSDSPSALKELSAVTSSLDRLTVCGILVPAQKSSRTTVIYPLPTLKNRL